MPRICITVPNSTPQPYRFPLDTEVVTIGRSATNDVVIDHGSVSSRHCEMKRVKGGFILSDLDSTNGIHLEEQQMEIVDLEHEGDVEVGDVLFNYQLKDEEQEELSEEKFKSHQKKKKQPKPKPKKQKAAEPSPPPSTPAPSYQGSPVLSSSDNSGARDFGIFLIFAFLALIFFYFGLNQAHRASIPKEERHGRTLLKDIQNPPTADSEKN